MMEGVVMSFEGVLHMYNEYKDDWLSFNLFWTWIKWVAGHVHARKGSLSYSEKRKLARMQKICVIVCTNCIVACVNSLFEWCPYCTLLYRKRATCTSQYFELFWPSTKLPLNWRKPENNSWERQENTEEIIEGLRAKRAYIGFWPIFIFFRIELIFHRQTCFDMKRIVP